MDENPRSEDSSECDPNSPGVHIKISERCFLCHSIVLCKTCNKCNNCCSNLPVGARLRNCWQTWLDLGAGPKVLLCQSPQEPLPAGGITSAYRQKRSRAGRQRSLGFLNLLFLVPKPNNKWRPILVVRKLNLFLKVEKFKMETPETIRTSLQQGEWVTSIDFKDAYFYIPIQEWSRKYQEISCPGSDITVQGIALWSVHSTHGAHCGSKGGETDGHTQGYKNPPVPRRLVGENQIPVVCQQLGWLVNLDKSELQPKQVFNFVGYQLNLKSGRV